MGRPRVTIFGLMTVVLIVATNCAVLRLFPLDTDNPNGLLVAGLVPMVNLLAIGLWRMVARRVEPGPARVGAQVVGWGALAVAVACFLGFPRLFESYIGWIESAVDPLARRAGLDYDSALSSYVVVPALLTTFFSLPLLALAGIGGWVHGRYKVVIVRRGPVAPEATAEGRSPRIEVAGL
jgi:hypothetical protein